MKVNLSEISGSDFSVFGSLNRVDKKYMTVVGTAASGTRVPLVD